MAKESKEYSIKDLQNKLKKINPFGGPITESAFSKVVEFIHTGNYHLNAVVSGDLFGGIPSNRSIQLAAPSGCGKTFVLLNICREAQLMGYNIIYYDTEGAVDIDNIKNFGINPENFDHQPTSDLSTFRTSITTLTKDLVEARKAGMKIPKIAIFLDSLGMLATTKEIEDAQSGSDKSDMTRAKVIRSLFRIITSDLTGLGIPLLVANHTYDGNSMFPTVNLSGGAGSIYSASIILTLTKAQLKEDKEDRIASGIVVSVKSFKNRFAKPQPIKFHISFSRGMNAYIGMEEYIDRETCGIQKGNIISQKEYEKSGNKNENYKFTSEDGEVVYFQPKETARNYIVKHLGRGVSIGELFTGKVFTKEVLTDINEKKIKPKFAYGIHELQQDEIEGLLDLDEEDDGDE